MTESMLKSPYYQDMLRAEDEAIRKAEEQLKLAEQRYAVRKKEVDAAKALIEAEAQLARDPGVADALRSLRSIYRTSQEIEDTILLEDFQNAWESAGRSIEWMNSQLEKQKGLNASVADSLRGLKSIFREMAQYETDFWNEMWDEIDARDKEAADNKKAALDKQIADLQAFYEKSSALRAENAERLRQQMEAEIEAINQKIEQVSGIMSSAFLSGFEDIIRGTKSVAEAFAQMVASIMYDVGRMMASEALTTLFRDILKGIYGQGGGRDISSSGVQAGSLDLPRYAPSTSGGRTGITINVNGARDATAVAREVRTAVLNLASTDSSVRRRLQLS
jgi:predicted  nucleic acid-binding Zn-ribbon protein